MDQEKRASFGRIQSPRQPLDATRPVERVHLADSSAHAAALHESIETALRLAARAARREGTIGDPDERSRHALNLACELARREELHVEQLLVLLKDAWRHLPEVQSVARIDADVTLAGVVTHCIKEFYRPSRRS